MRVENPVLALVFFLLAAVASVDLVESSSAITNGQLVDKNAAFPNDPHSPPYCDIWVLTTAGRKVVIRTDVKTCAGLSRGDALSTEASAIFGRTTAVIDRGMTLRTPFGEHGGIVFFGFVAALTLTVGSITLRFSEQPVK